MSWARTETPLAWTVTRLTQEIQDTLRESLPPLWVEGEISNFSRSGAGHVYLTLKDESSQVRAVIFRNHLAAVPFELQDGLEVLAFGSVDVYAARGWYQLRVRAVHPKGMGPLELAFRQLRERLEREGLFRPERKRPIPRFPRCVAVVTSPQGAAVRDFLEVAGRRWQATPILLVPSAVQGERAPAELQNALEAAQRSDADVIVLIRGGGSLEDLWAFNDEGLARTIAACRIPIVTGIGHEVDVTIADLVADLRALTPSEAAERIFPDAASLRGAMAQLEQRLASQLTHHLDQAVRRLESIESAPPFRRPGQRLEEWIRRTDDLEEQLCRALGRRLDDAQRTLDLRAGTLDALSPLGVLARGYSLTTRLADGKLVRDAAELRPLDRLRLRFTRGQVTCRVDEVGPNDG